MARKSLFPFLMAAALAGGYMPGYTQSTGETAGAVHPAILPEDSARAIRRQPPTVEQQAERISRQMQRRLVLDNKQYAKVYKLNLKYLKKLEDSATGWKTSPDRPEGFGGRMGGPHGSGGPGRMGHRDGMPRPGGKDRPGGPGAGRPPMDDKSQMKEKRPHGISLRRTFRARPGKTGKTVQENPIRQSVRRMAQDGIGARRQSVPRTVPAGFRVGTATPLETSTLSTHYKSSPAPHKVFPGFAGDIHIHGCCTER
ncbi:MAG: hypothetical protein ACLR8Y_06365 [Alistipes indistinctus]